MQSKPAVTTNLTLSRRLLLTEDVTQNVTLHLRFFFLKMCGKLCLSSVCVKFLCSSACSVATGLEILEDLSPLIWKASSVLTQSWESRGFTLLWRQQRPHSSQRTLLVWKSSAFHMMTHVTLTAHVVHLAQRKWSFGRSFWNFGTDLY